MESISTFDIFKIGVGPSSSHTMGPWKAALRFVSECSQNAILDRVIRVQVDLYGSLAKTGKGHGTDIAVMLGLQGESPETCDTSAIDATIAAIRSKEKLTLAGGKEIPFHLETDLLFHRDVSLPFHPNGMTITAFLDDGSAHEETYYSIGGGFIVQEGAPLEESRSVSLPFPIETAAQMLHYCDHQKKTIPEIVWQNELAWREPDEIHARLEKIWETMRDCVYRGCMTGGVLPGSLGVVRRAAGINRKLLAGSGYEAGLGLESWMEAIRHSAQGFQETLTWVTCFALAVNEENASFGRVVTAPTNGAAGVIPAALMYLACFRNAGSEEIEQFLLTAAEIASLFKKGATLSAAMGGCQAEIGVSSAMAAAGLCQVIGGSPAQVLMAAEIAMEHHLGLTCDPVGGLVQIPCIERNTMGVVKAITSCFLALESDPNRAKVPLDTVIQTMWQTAKDMNAKYKETSEGGLAVLIPISLSEC